MFKAKIKVTLKKAILDPQGKAIEGALHALKYINAANVRIGKYIELTLKEKDEKAARQKIEEMSKKLLSNPVMEDFTFELEKIK